MSILLEAATPFVLLMPGFLPLLFFSYSRLVCCSSPAKPAPVICIFVSLLAPLATLAASLDIVVLEFRDQARSVRVAKDIIQSFVELGYRASILYLVTPRSFVVRASRISLSHKDIYRHNGIFSAILFTTFLTTVIQATFFLSTISIVIPLSLSILAALFPVPLVVHLALSAQSARVRRIWAFIAILQVFSAIAAALNILHGPGYALSSALFTVLWGGGVITLFHTLSSVPLPSPMQKPLRLPKISTISPTPSTPVRVHYEASNAQYSGALISEDFTALRDPFASPPPVSPVSFYTTIPRPPSPIFTSPPRIVLSPPPTPSRKPHRPPKPKVREIKPQRRNPGKKPSSAHVGRPTSSQSLVQPLAAASQWRASDSGSDDALFLNDEALLSQILLHSLTLDAPPSTSGSPAERASTISEGRTTMCSDTISVITVKTRRDENGRRYASEEVRYSDCGTSQEGDDEPFLQVGEEKQRSDSKTMVSKEEEETREGLERTKMQSMKQEGGADVWWAKQ